MPETLEGGGVKFTLDSPRYKANDAFFQVIMHNIGIIDMALAGMEGYSSINVPLLIDSLLGKVLNPEERKRLKELKTETVKKHTEGIDRQDDKNAAILAANMDVYGEIIYHFAKYMTFETRLAVIKS